ncbi:MEKHLA domain-containing protein [Enterobacillus tribolii]|uniref:MEKHLA domain-containing protein n=1 Tax=Enterobacillus tribolii TaxID=1487935 RepID=A0A370QRX7_9GAMM|nr:MEKHLA domain-containing protein [Enterobacillus tribolii]MBW7983496.1 MEKHLA domain-containing protein [Enterobacillus tribolii]RDK92008.1 MEKHLA domain-containing protein [Enterobacillus tribolii]
MKHFPDKALIEHIDLCYHQLSGEPLPSPKSITGRAWWLHQEAPYAILAHGVGPDPHFIYANQCALACFKYSREEMMGLPSRLSAANTEQQERQRMLDTLATKGIVHGYSGIRITSRGESFRIYNGVIWQLQNDDKSLWGQGALFWPTEEEAKYRF